MKPYYAYSFLAGLYIGGYTNLFSKVVISSLVIYIVNPENFNPKRFTPLYNSMYEKLQPYISKIYSIDSILDMTSSSSSLSPSLSSVFPPSLSSSMPLSPSYLIKSPLPPLSFPSPINSNDSKDSTIKLKIK